MDGMISDVMDRNNNGVAGQFEGKILIAMPGLAESSFERSVIYICAHSEDGAMGFQVNKDAGMTIADLVRKTDLIDEIGEHALMPSYADAIVREGGPVEEQRGFVLHSNDCQFDATIEVSDTVCLTSNVEILKAIATGQGPEKYAVCLGYSGWSAGQLESEIAENAWLVFDADEDVVYMAEHEQKYNAMLGQLGINPAHLTAQSGSA